MLVAHFVAARPGAAMPSAAVMARLQAHAWLGNVRELRTLVGRASVQGWDVAMAEGFGAVAGEDAPSAAAARDPEPEDELSPVGGTYYKARRRWIERGERAYIPWLLEKYQQSITRASVAAGIDPSTLRKIVKRLTG